MNRACRVISLFLLTLMFFSCSSTRQYKKLLKSDDHEAKYEAAMKAYEKGDYSSALQLFENLLLYARGREHSEKVNFYYAKSLLGSGDNYSAGFQFESFVKWFPYSEYAEEALFQAAYCKYMESPDYMLDQTLTRESINDFQSYVERYPKSERVAQVNGIMDELRNKLIKKDYYTAYNYYKTGEYQAAQTSLKNFLNDYPDATSYRENAMYYIVLAGYEYAKKSVEDKQKERYESVIMDYERYEVTFSNLKNNVRKKELEKIYADSKSKYESLK